MSHCVSIPMIFVSAIFARLSRQMTRATLTAKMGLLPKCVIAHVSWRGLHLLPKWRPTCAHKKSRTQFLLSEISGTIYHLCWNFVLIAQTKTIEKWLDFLDFWTRVLTQGIHGGHCLSPASRPVTQLSLPAGEVRISGG